MPPIAPAVKENSTAQSVTIKDTNNARNVNRTANAVTSRENATARSEIQIGEPMMISAVASAEREVLTRARASVVIGISERICAAAIAGVPTLFTASASESPSSMRSSIISL